MFTILNMTHSLDGYPKVHQLRVNSHGKKVREPFLEATSTAWESYEATKVGGANHIQAFYGVLGKSAWKWILAPSLPYQFLLCHIRNQNLIPNLKSRVVCVPARP
jgi:hypothetical protein